MTDIFVIIDFSYFYYIFITFCYVFSKISHKIYKTIIIFKVKFDDQISIYFFSISFYSTWK